MNYPSLECPANREPLLFRASVDTFSVHSLEHSLDNSRPDCTEEDAMGPTPIAQGLMRPSSDGLLGTVWHIQPNSIDLTMHDSHRISSESEDLSIDLDRDEMVMSPIQTSRSAAETPDEIHTITPQRLSQPMLEFDDDFHGRFDMGDWNNTRADGTLQVSLDFRPQDPQSAMDHSVVLKENIIDSLEHLVGCMSQTNETRKLVKQQVAFLPGLYRSQATPNLEILMDANTETSLDHAKCRAILLNSVCDQLDEEEMSFHADLF